MTPVKYAREKKFLTKKKYETLEGIHKRAA